MELEANTHPPYHMRRLHLKSPSANEARETSGDVISWPFLVAIGLMSFAANKNFLYDTQSEKGLL
jgi:hypothetical protein